MRWYVGGTFALALLLGAGCLTQGGGVDSSSLLPNGAESADGALAPFAVDGRACVADLFTFAAGARYVTDHVAEPFEPVMVSNEGAGATSVVAMYLSCSPGTVDGEPLASVTLGGLFAVVRGELTDPRALSLYALQPYATERAVVDRFAALGAGLEHAPAVHRMVHPEVPGVGGVLDLDVTLADGGYAIDGVEARGEHSSAPAALHVWMAAPAGFVQFAIDMVDTAAAGGEGQLRPEPSSLVNELRPSVWHHVDEWDDNSAIQGALVRLDFEQRGRVDLVLR